MHRFFSAHKEDIERYESARLMSQHMVSGGQFLKPERDRFSYARQRIGRGCHRRCMCKCAETKREALDGVKPSWCHYSSDRHFLSLNLSSERRRDKYTAEF